MRPRHHRKKVESKCHAKFLVSPGFLSQCDMLDTHISLLISGRTIALQNKANYVENKTRRLVISFLSQSRAAHFLWLISPSRSSSNFASARELHPDLKFQQEKNFSLRRNLTSIEVESITQQYHRQFAYNCFAARRWRLKMWRRNGRTMNGKEEEPSTLYSFFI